MSTSFRTIFFYPRNNEEDFYSTKTDSSELVEYTKAIAELSLRNSANFSRKFKEKGNLYK